MIRIKLHFVYTSKMSNQSYDTNGSLFSVIECPSITVKVENEEISGSAKILMTKACRLEAELYLEKNVGYYNKFVSITGLTKDKVKFTIDNPLVTHMIFPKFPIKITMSRLSFEGNTTLQPDNILCYLKNSKTHLFGDIKFESEEFKLDSIKKDEYCEKGGLGARLTINISHKPLNEVENVIDGICSLLSIFQRVLINIAYIERRCGTELVSAEVTFPQKTSPL